MSSPIRMASHFSKTRVSSSTTGSNLNIILMWHYSSNSSQCKYAILMLATLGLGLTKASILVFFRNIFTIRRFKLWADIMLAIVGAWTISFFFSSLFICYPVTALIEPYYGNNCINQVAMWYASCITDFLIDVAILALPIPMVLKLQVHWHQKVGLLLIFLLGTS